MKRLAVLLAVALAACGPDGSGPSTGAVGAQVKPGKVTLPVTVQSADGRRVTVKDTRRIIPLWDNIAEVVFALGLGDRVVARDTSTTFAEAKKLPLVTRAHDVTAESVLSLHPTLILADELSGPPEALRQIRDVGVTVVVFRRPTSVAEIPAQIRRIAAALGVKDTGAQLAAKATTSTPCALACPAPRRSRASRSSTSAGTPVCHSSRGPVRASTR